MANRQGRVNRKKRPDPVIPEEPPLVINCLCPLCEASFVPEQLAGRYLERRCPACNSVIDTKDIDALARKTLADLPELREREAACEARIQKLRQWVDRTTFFLWSPVHRFLKKKLAAASEDRVAIRRQQRQRRKRVESLARMHYYLSEWFLRTGIPLKRTVIEPFDLVPFYDGEGVWRLPRGRREISGMTAEFAVFQALLDRVVDPTSPLYQAHVVPNVYLPRPLEYTRKGRSFWDQVDLIVLTRQAAFVIEVKRRYKDIVANAPFKDIRSKHPNVSGTPPFSAESSNAEHSASWETNDTTALSQNSRHAVAFSDLRTPYEFERIYEQVVFVGVNSFSSDTEGFVDNVSVSCLSDEAHFIKPIEEVCRKLAPVATQGVVEKLGDDLVSQYGDLNQKRALIHARRIREMAS